MKNSLLLPNRVKIVGWVVFILSSVIQFLSSYFQWQFPAIVPSYIDKYIPRYNWAGEPWSTIDLAFIIIGLMFIAFARERQEDEFISFIRLNSWQRAVLISFTILFNVNLFVYGTWFLTFMLFSMFTVLIVFIITFYWSLFKLKRAGVKDEK